MKRLFFYVLCLGLLFLTGCGARVVSQTDFELDGSGMRDVQIYLSDIVSQVTEEDLAKIDEILKAAVPEGMNYARSVEANGELKYHFMFSFSDIDDYNAKVLAFTGKRHHATWFTEGTVFQRDIAFSEKECGYELASWAVKALQNSEYKRLTTLFDSKTPQESVFTLAEEEMIRGSGEDPSFTKALAPAVTEIAVYSDFAENEAPRKKIVLKADAEKMKLLDVKLGAELLTSWCKEARIDRGNGVITLSFPDSESFRKFLKKADPAYREENLSYVNTVSPFAVEFEVSEKYVLTKFLGLFRVEANHVLDYLAFPDLPDLGVEHLSTVTNPVTAEGYDLQGAYGTDKTYVLHASSRRQAELVKMDVSYSFDTPESGERQIRLTFDKKGCPVTKTVLEEALLARGITASAADLGETITATVVDKIGPGALRRFDDYGDGNPAVKARAFADLCVLTDYLPAAGEGLLAAEHAACTVRVSVAQAAKVKTFSIGDTEYAPKEEDFEKGSFVTEETWTGESVNVEVHTAQTSMTFWIVLTVILLIAAVIGSGIAIYYFRKSQAAKAAAEKAAENAAENAAEKAAEKADTEN